MTETTRPRPPSSTRSAHRPAARAADRRGPPGRASSTAPSAPRPSNGSCTSSYDQFADRATVAELPAAARRTVRPAAAARPGQGRGQGHATASRSCCSCAPTTPAAPRWRSGSSPTSPATRAVAWSGGSEPGDRGQPGRDRGDGRTRHRHLRRVPQAVDRRDRPRRRRRGHHGLRRRLPDLPRHAATRTGTSTTRPASTSTTSARSATRSNAASAACSTELDVPPVPPDRRHGHLTVTARAPLAGGWSPSSSAPACWSPSWSAPASPPSGSRPTTSACSCWRTPPPPSSAWPC